MWYHQSNFNVGEFGAREERRAPFKKEEDIVQKIRSDFQLPSSRKVLRCCPGIVLEEGEIIINFLLSSLWIFEGESRKSLECGHDFSPLL